MGRSPDGERPAAPAPGNEMTTVYRVTRPNYFSTMRVPILAGRDFTDLHDDAKAPPVAIINETVAQRVFRGEDPIGKRITFSHPDGQPVWMTIVGVIRDMKQQSWSEAPGYEVHVPFLQSDQFLSGKNPWTASMTLIVRTAIDAASATSSIKSAVWSVDRSLPLSQIRDARTRYRRRDLGVAFFAHAGWAFFGSRADAGDDRHLRRDGV